ncbi:HlyD family secretion protein [Shimwellia pseudoproteus]|uniref:efflux RND transporter periplasmic adaptor subunit n=1 Tax=Shimwellia pseudoproteus TaxID=570012 RepID=UPI0018EC4CB9|nr:HlyD family secretion protein [Shimwellia pseudoproteus]MBJ3814018.1 HlyD family secretion protein [Shimwellia pseudoproteus]
MKLKTIKYFSTVLVFAIAVVAGWMAWNYYMQSPWTRDGKVRAEQVSITPQVSGTITQLMVKDNQFVHAGSVLFTLDQAPLKIAVLNAEAMLAKAHADTAKARHEALRRQNLPQNYISAEDLDSANLGLKAAIASEAAAQAVLSQARWQLEQSTVRAPVDGWVTNLTTREGNFATAGQPVFALVDSHSFYVLGYFEETKLHNIRVGDSARIILYNGGSEITGTVDSIGRAIFDQSTENSSDLIPDVKPNIPWVRLAQRVPVRIRLDRVPADATLVSGTTCTISISHP